jgi:GxxExxY protein
VTENEIAKQVLDAAFAVHTNLGPGLLESVYEVVLQYELKKRGLIAERQKPMSIVYDSIRFDEAFRSDVVVNGKVIAELKSLEALASGACETASDATAFKRHEAGPSHQFWGSAPKERD